MNALNRNIKPGEIVIIAQGWWCRLPDRDDRRFRCQEGPGMKRYAFGDTISGTWIGDIATVSVSGYAISVKETKQYQKERQS